MPNPPAVGRAVEAAAASDRAGVTVVRRREHEHVWSEALQPDGCPGPSAVRRLQEPAGLGEPPVPRVEDGEKREAHARDHRDRLPRAAAVVASEEPPAVGERPAPHRGEAERRRGVEPTRARHALPAAAVVGGANHEGARPSKADCPDGARPCPDELRVYDVPEVADVPPRDAAVGRGRDPARREDARRADPESTGGGRERDRARRQPRPGRRDPGPVSARIVGSEQAAVLHRQRVDRPSRGERERADEPLVVGKERLPPARASVPRAPDATSIGREEARPGVGEGEVADVAASGEAARALRPVAARAGAPSPRLASVARRVEILLLAPGAGPAAADEEAGARVDEADRDRAVAARKRKTRPRRAAVGRAVDALARWRGPAVPGVDELDRAG